MSLFDDLFGGTDSSSLEADWQWRRAVADHANREFPQIQQILGDQYGLGLNAINQNYR